MHDEKQFNKNIYSRLNFRHQNYIFIPASIEQILLLAQQLAHWIHGYFDKVDNASKSQIQAPTNADDDHIKSDLSSQGSSQKTCENCHTEVNLQDMEHRGTPCGMMPIVPTVMDFTMSNVGGAFTLISEGPLPNPLTSFEPPDSPTRLDTIILEEQTYFRHIIPIAPPVIPIAPPENLPPTDGNETYYFQAADLSNKSTFVNPDKLANSSDPDSGDILTIEHFGTAAINLVTIYSITQTGSIGFYTLTYLPTPGDFATITIDASGKEIITDYGALKHLGKNQVLEITTFYTVGDNHGALANESHESIFIKGFNSAPTDGNEIYHFNARDLVCQSTLVTPTKLANASDPNYGDTLSIVHFGTATINLDCAFSILQTGNLGIYTITYLNNPCDTATISIDASGKEIITDYGALKHLGKNQVLEITTIYTVGDNHGALANESHESIFIKGFNSAPTDGNEIYHFNARDLVCQSTLVTPTKLANASDPNYGDTLSIVNFGAATINLDCAFSIQQTGNLGIYTITYLNNPCDTATITIDASGNEIITDYGALKHLSKNQVLEITTFYTVGDNHGALAAQSHESIFIKGFNSAPTDGNEVYHFNVRDLICQSTQVTPTKLANASDPNYGDTLSIVSFGTATINLECAFSIQQTGNLGIYTITYLNNPCDTATITIDASGNEIITDYGALKHLGKNQVLEITTFYTVGDNHGALAAQSHESIFITGFNSSPTDGNEVYHFNARDLICQSTQVTPTKLANASDPNYGDTLSIVNFGAATINLDCAFSIQQTGNLGIYTITYLNNPCDTATITIDASGNEIITDYGALDHLSSKDSLHITTFYTVGDNHGALASESREDIIIQGQNHCPTIDDEIRHCIPKECSKDPIKGNIYSEGNAQDLDDDPINIYSINNILDGGFYDRDHREGYIKVVSAEEALTVNTLTGDYSLKINDCACRNHDDNSLKFSILITDGNLSDDSKLCLTPTTLEFVSTFSHEQPKISYQSEESTPSELAQQSIQNFSLITDICPLNNTAT